MTSVMDMGIMDGAFIVIGAFVLLLFVAVVIVGWVLMSSWWQSRGRRYPSCGGCNYDLSGSLGQTAVCPECGSSLESVGIHPISSGPTVANLVGLAMLVMGLAVGVPYILSVLLG